MPLGTYLHGSAPANLRGLMMLALSEAGVLWSGSAATDSGGGVTQVWTAGAAVPCRIDPVGGGIGGGIGPMTGGRLDERSSHLVTVPSDTTVALAQRFAISGRGSFEITAIRKQTDELATTFEVAEI